VAAQLLETLLLQDVEQSCPTEGSTLATIKEGTASGRIPSATDPQQRHGRKSAGKSFTGHKASLACDLDSQIIVAVDLLSGDASDNKEALGLVQQAQRNTDLPVTEALGDCAYGDGATRQAFAEANVVLYARVPKEVEPQGRFPKSAFTIDLHAHTVTCPAGHTVGEGVLVPYRGLRFRFGRLCRDCPLRDRCSPARNGRTLTLHPQERLLQAARAYQQSPQGKAHLRQRVAVEHALARLSGLGIGQARYFGRVKTGFQLLMAATVVNLRRTWNWQAQKPQTASMTARRGRVASFSVSWPRFSVGHRAAQICDHAAYVWSQEQVKAGRKPLFGRASSHGAGVMADLKPTHQSHSRSGDGTARMRAGNRVGSLPFQSVLNADAFGDWSSIVTRPS
jgi:hypothetical protein